MAGNVKESTHFSQKGLNVAPGVVVWPCCLYRPLFKPAELWSWTGQKDKWSKYIWTVWLQRNFSNAERKDFSGLSYCVDQWTAICYCYYYYFFLTGKRLLHFNNASSCTRVPSSSVFCGTFSLQCYCVVLLSCLIVSTCNTFHQEMFIHMIMFFLHDFTLKLPVPLFQRVTPRKYSTLSQELYVFHRWGLIE